MAKRKAARQSTPARKPTSKKAAASARAARPGARKAATRKAGARKGSGRKAGKAAAPRPTARKAGPARKSAPARKAKASKRAPARKAVARRAAPAKGASSKPAARKAPAAKPTVRKAVPARTSSARTRSKQGAAVDRLRAPRPAQRAPVAPERKAPSLDRARRVVLDDEIVLSPPSALDMDRTASSARSGRRALHDRLADHKETGPGMTGGDIDADWESAYSVGDEAPGGDNPTPDQDIVDDIGRALGNEYQDNEPLKGADKIAQRDKHRWELDPGSKEDFDDREVDVDLDLEGDDTGDEDDEL